MNSKISEVNTPIDELKQHASGGGVRLLDDVFNEALENVNSDDLIGRSKGLKNTYKDLESAQNKIALAKKLFIDTSEDMFVKALEMEDSVKKTCGKVRDSQQKLIDIFKKFEQSMNISKIEKQVELLERTADAMERLEKLQSSGKLDKILLAMK